MFFGKNDKEALSQILSLGRENRSLTEQSGNRIDALEKAAGKHDIVLEDLSDTLAELREQEVDSIHELRQELDTLRHERTALEEEQEEKLLMLLMEYESSLRNLEMLLADNEEWARQFEMIRHRIRKKCLPAGLVLLGQEGEAVDYEIHEVADIRETDDMMQNRHVAQVYETGFSYRGRIRKARVSVWKAQDAGRM